MRIAGRSTASIYWLPSTVYNTSRWNKVSTTTTRQSGDRWRNIVATGVELSSNSGLLRWWLFDNNNNDVYEKSCGGTTKFQFDTVYQIIVGAWYSRVTLCEKNGRAHQLIKIAVIGSMAKRVCRMAINAGSKENNKSIGKWHRFDD